MQLDLFSRCEHVLVIATLRISHVRISICMQDMDSYSRTAKKSTSYGNAVLLKDPLLLIQGPCNQQRGPQQNQTSHRAL